MYQAYNLTPREAYRINGTLSDESIESLLDAQESIEAAEGVSYQIQEAAGSLPPEDFLFSFIRDLNELSKRTRGQTQQTARELVQEAKRLQIELTQMAEYAADELKQARKTLEEAGL